jgi:hypothetical protein
MEEEVAPILAQCSDVLEFDALLMRHMTEIHNLPRARQHRAYRRVAT